MFVLHPDFEHDAVCRMYVADIDCFGITNWIEYFYCRLSWLYRIHNSKLIQTIFYIVILMSHMITQVMVY